MKGFHNSFARYCEWCDRQIELGLNTVNWGTWWDEIAEKDNNEQTNASNVN